MRVLTNNMGLQYAIESTIGVLPGTPRWRKLEPNNIGAYGAEITKVSRRPISGDRGRKKGTTTDLESTVEFDADLTLDSFTNFAEGFIFAEYVNIEFNLNDAKAGIVALDVTGTGYDLATDAGITTVDDMTNSTEVAAKMQWVTLAQATLVFAKGYVLDANNGLKVLTADITSASTEVTVAGTAIETAPAKASLQVAGMQVSDGDLTFTKSGLTATLVSGADLDWTTTGIKVGQYIHIGSNNGSGAVQNALKATVTDDTFGYARVTGVAATTLTLDKLDVNLAANATNTGEGVADTLYGRFLRNVAITADSNDTRFLELSYQFELLYPDLGGAGNDELEYAIGNFANELALNIPLTEKATASWGFIGTNSDDIVAIGSRKDEAANAISPLRNVAINTSSDIASLTTDLIALASDVCFKSLTITFRNNVSLEKCLGKLGATFVNTGLFEVNIEGQLLFTNKKITNDIKNNVTATFAAILKNEDGALVIDIPALTFGGGDREFPVDQSVLVNLSGEAFNDPTGSIPDVSLGISLFADVPTARP